MIKINIIRTTPNENFLTMDMAKTAIVNEELGQNEVINFLAASFSSPDCIGHKFGVNAIEVEDTYLRLDQNLVDFFEFFMIKLEKGIILFFLPQIILLPIILLFSLIIYYD